MPRIGLQIGKGEAVHLLDGHQPASLPVRQVGVTKGEVVEPLLTHPGGCHILGLACLPGSHQDRHWEEEAEGDV